MKRFVALAIVGLIIAVSSFAGPQAVLSGLKGKVEVKPLNGDWIPATEGMKVDLRTTLSTGFDSTATIVIDKSKIVVKPLTRLTLDKLLEKSSGSVAASMFLRVGAVQASVKATVPGTPQDFKVQSPYSTASVRGTEFAFDGFHLAVIDGVVRMVPGRPERDYGGGDGLPPGDPNDGFQGTGDIGGANPNGGVNVGAGQNADLHLGNNGAGASLGNGGGGGGGGGGHHGGGSASGSVIITISTAQ